MVIAAGVPAKVTPCSQGLPLPSAETVRGIMQWGHAGRQGGDAVVLCLSDKIVAGQTRRKRTLRTIPAPMTTLMIRNVPLDLTVEDVLSMWPPKDNYDYLYLPQDSSHVRKTSYCFINFTSHEKAIGFNEQWHGHFMPYHKAPRSLSITVAGTQGLRANLSRHSSMDLDCMAKHGTLPITLYNNQYVDSRLLFLALGLQAEEAVRSAGPYALLASEAGEEACPQEDVGAECTEQPSVEEMPLPNFLDLCA
mmetsp:Transcript_78031/g.189072  ORF Transcript_78031/g.189072 Transcript_78031/m.189072 type:complete len:250 (+) Transcript_78031:73-822(+)